ncbi:MAG: hypothetical protein GEV10_19760 [Streptosporangiales bacterium]|nr:hypothetical protein [Streptosporangiales bacterium]
MTAPLDEPDRAAPPDEGPAAPPPPAPRRSRLPTLTLALAGVLVLVLGFVGGIGVSRLTGGGPQAGGPGGTPLTKQSAMVDGAGVTLGTIERIDGNTVYVKTPDGKTVKVNASDKTEVRVSSTASVDDLEPGENVVVRGDADDKGSVEADRIDQGGDLPTRSGRTRGP